jgi:hypothetical protein
LLDFDSCLYELRAIGATGTALSSEPDYLKASITVGEQRDYQPDKNMSWSLMGAAAKSHVTSATFRDAADESKPLYVFQTGGPAPEIVSSGFVTQREGASLNGFFDILAGGRGIVDVRTDIPGRETLRITLVKQSQQDWYRPKCG